MQIRLLTFIIALVFVLVACETDDTASDTLSAQNQQPAIVGFQTTDLDTAADAILTTTAGTAVASGNVPLAVAIQRADSLLDCLQETGSVSGLTYVEENFDIIPQMGASLLVNKTRVQRNVFNCLSDTGFSAQSAIDLEPCAAYGEFSLQGEEYWFAYVGAGNAICAGFNAHYSSLNATILGEYLAPVSP